MYIWKKLMILITLLLTTLTPLQASGAGSLGRMRIGVNNCILLQQQAVDFLEKNKMDTDGLVQKDPNFWRKHFLDSIAKHSEGREGKSDSTVNQYYYQFHEAIMKAVKAQRGQGEMDLETAMPIMQELLRQYKRGPKQTVALATQGRNAIRLSDFFKEYAKKSQAEKEAIYEKEPVEFKTIEEQDSFERLSIEDKMALTAGRRVRLGNNNFVIVYPKVFNQVMKEVRIEVRLHADTLAEFISEPQKKAGNYQSKALEIFGTPDATLWGKERGLLAERMYLQQAYKELLHFTTGSITSLPGIKTGEQRIFLEKAQKAIEAEVTRYDPPELIQHSYKEFLSVESAKADAKVAYENTGKFFEKYGTARTVGELAVKVGGYGVFIGTILWAVLKGSDPFKKKTEAKTPCHLSDFSTTDDTCYPELISIFFPAEYSLIMRNSYSPLFTNGSASYNKLKEKVKADLQADEKSAKRNLDFVMHSILHTLSTYQSNIAQIETARILSTVKNEDKKKWIKKLSFLMTSDKAAIYKKAMLVIRDHGVNDKNNQALLEQIKKEDTFVFDLVKMALEQIEIENNGVKQQQSQPERKQKTEEHLDGYRQIFSDSTVSI